MELKETFVSRQEIFHGRNFIGGMGHASYTV